MLRRTLNLGILAHVDAGKTTLTERLLYAAGVVDAPGSVDKGTTQTDSLALERERGITIKSAVVSFPLDDVTVNLVDTPGHPDFIAEVERVLGVLDGVVLVLSAVEGVQPQTRVLMRALQRLRLPTLLFVNKIDRLGAEPGRVLDEIHRRLTPAAVALTTATGVGTRAAAVARMPAGDAALCSRLLDVLAEHDDDLLAAYLDDERAVRPERLQEALSDQTRRARVHPVFLGSAATGAGVELLASGVVRLLPASNSHPGEPVSGTVFKIERGAAGERIAYARLFSGTVSTRDRIRVGADREEKVTAIAVFAAGSTERRAAVRAGEVAKLWGLASARIGDALGDAPPRPVRHEFPPPTLEATIEPRDPRDRQRLRLALTQLAEQDPLIDLRQDELDDLSISLFGEVQLQVVQATLERDYGLEVDLRDATPLYVERPSGTGEALELLHADSNPHLATIGLRVEPAPEGSGVEFRAPVDVRTVPLYVFKTAESFTAHMDGYVRDALHAGRFGWRVTDCLVTLTRCGYSIPDGPPSRRGPPSTAADFRKLTPLVLAQALERAGTVVCEPSLQVLLELPAAAVGAVLPALARLGGSVEAPAGRGELATLQTTLPAARAQELQRQLAGLTGGEGTLESTFAGYRPVSGEQPRRRRSS